MIRDTFNKILSDEARIVEVILFLENTSLPLSRICQLSSLEKDIVLKAIEELKENYEERNAGLVLVNEEETYSFQPEKSLYPLLRHTYGRKVERRLSRASLEVLSIVAYSQPITRSEIRDIRGVNSDSIIKLLRERDYIKVSGRDENHKCLYCTTRKFLYEFKLKSISDLPKLSEHDRLKFEEKDEEEL